MGDCKHPIVHGLCRDCRRLFAFGPTYENPINEKMAEALKPFEYATEWVHSSHPDDEALGIVVADAEKVQYINKLSGRVIVSEAPRRFTVGDLRRLVAAASAVREARAS